MGENANLTYYQKNKDLILNKAKNYYENNNEGQKNRREINIEAYLKKKKIKGENTERIGIVICLKKSCEKQKKYILKKATEYYLKNKEAITEKSKERYKNLSQEEKDKTKEYQKKWYQELVQHKKEALKNK